MLGLRVKIAGLH
jgi:hypothetical protein